MESSAEPRRREQLLELLVFLFLIVPSILISLFAFNPGQAGFLLLAVSTIFRDMALVALILFFLWRNEEPWTQIGWTRISLLPNLAIGLVLFPAVLLGAAFINGVLREVGVPGPVEGARQVLAPRGNEELILALVLVIVVAISEETIFRGYLITRLHSITGSMPAALLLSSAVFSIGHGYEGTTGIIAVGSMGLAFALLFVWRRSLVAPITIHFLNNLVALVLVPFLGAG